MGSAVGQVPEYIEMVARWCKAAHAHAGDRQADAEHHRHPLPGARRAQGRRRRRVADQHDQLDHLASISTRFSPNPTIDGKGSHGGYCGPAVKPIALNMVSEIARDARDARPADLRHRRHHHLARRGRVHGARLRHRAGLHRGDDLRLQDRAGDDRRAGPTGWTRRAIARVDDFVGRAVPNVTDWQYLNLNYVTKARIDQDLCIKCGRCHIVCEDTSHQAITAHGGRQAPLRGDRRRMRRLQSLRRGLPGRELHHHGAADGRASTRAPARAVEPATPTGRRTRTIRWRGKRRSSLSPPDPPLRAWRDGQHCNPWRAPLTLPSPQRGEGGAGFSAGRACDCTTKSIEDRNASPLPSGERAG